MFVHNWLTASECFWVHFENVGVNFAQSIPNNVFQVLNNSFVSLTKINSLPPADRLGKSDIELS